MEALMALATSIGIAAWLILLYWGVSLVASTLRQQLNRLRRGNS